ncbi:MAG: glycerophosphodiester phosphodiesterase family protein [Hyphomicrobiaceae bacterium]
MVATIDRAQFIRPIAHRGLHDRSAGVIENTGPAFHAAIDAGYGIECDLQPASDGTPMVFHDRALKRLIDAEGMIDERTPAELAKLRYRGQDTPILTYADFLALVGGRVPLLVEIKSDWDPPKTGFLEAIAAASTAYDGPLALMSFDPAVMARCRALAPSVPRGIVATDFTVNNWWPNKIDAARAISLTYLLESREAEPSFFAYHVRALPTPVTRFAREGLGLPLFTWTVRTEHERAIAARWADAPIFEGYRP